MTDDLRARLEADQRVIEEATEGPWEKGDGWVYTKPVYDDDTRLSNVLGMRYADRDRERQEADRAQRNVNFIAASRTRWEQANKALLAVLELCDTFSAPTMHDSDRQVGRIEGLREVRRLIEGAMQ